jgi:hypothetical protein
LAVAHCDVHDVGAVGPNMVASGIGRVAEGAVGIWGAECMVDLFLRVENTLAVGLRGTTRSWSALIPERGEPSGCLTLA